MPTKKKKKKITLMDFKNKVIEIALYLISYTITFLIVEHFFKSFYISSDYKILYSFLAVTIIYVLNQVVKPLIVTLTMPITGITFGLFYFVINTLILKLTDWIMRDKLNFTDIWVLFFISIILSILRFVIEELIMKPLLKKALSYE